MPKYAVTCSAIWVDSPGGRVSDRRKNEGAIIDLSAKEAKAHVDAGRLTPLKEPKKRKAKE